MIQASELRIGNLVSEKVLGMCKVVGLAQDCLGVDNGDETQVYNLNYENVHPICLTPEILEKCGFAKRIDTKWKPGPLVSYHLHEFMYIDNIKWRGMDMKNVEYLHQLQNLVFALRGKELGINF